MSRVRKGLIVTAVVTLFASLSTGLTFLILWGEGPSSTPKQHALTEQQQLARGEAVWDHLGPAKDNLYVLRAPLHGKTLLCLEDLYNNHPTLSCDWADWRAKK